MGKSWGVDVVGELDELLADGAAVVEKLRELPWWQLGEDQLLTATQRVETLLRSAFGVQVRLAAEIEERGIAKARSVSSTARLLSQLLAITPGEARGRVLAAATMLVPEPAEDSVEEPVEPQLQVLATAIDAGEIGFDHSRVIITAMRAIPAKVDADLRDQCEQVLVEAAKDRDANRLKEVAEQIRNITDPDGSLNDLDATDRVELIIGSRRGDGLTPFRGLLDGLGVEFLRQAVEPLAKPRPAGPDLPDPRPVGLRRGQALVEVLRRFLRVGAGPRSGGVRPHAMVTIGLNELAAARGIATLDFAGTVSARIARLLVCDAAVLPVVMESNGLPLEAWAIKRLFPASLRHALAARDGAGCAWPGCDIPSGWCDGHHIVFWANGGPTVVENGVLLCGFHHTEIHRERWVCRMAADGRPEFVPPRWLDPTQRPRRNHLFTAIEVPGASGVTDPTADGSLDADTARPADAVEDAESPTDAGPAEPAVPELVEPAESAEPAESVEPGEPPAPVEPTVRSEPIVPHSQRDRRESAGLRPRGTLRPTSGPTQMQRVGPSHYGSPVRPRRSRHLAHQRGCWARRHRLDLVWPLLRTGTGVIIHRRE